MTEKIINFPSGKEWRHVMQDGGVTLSADKPLTIAAALYMLKSAEIHLLKLAEVL